MGTVSRRPSGWTEIGGEGLQLGGHLMDRLGAQAADRVGGCGEVRLCEERGKRRIVQSAEPQDQPGLQLGQLGIQQGEGGFLGLNGLAGSICRTPASQIGVQVGNARTQVFPSDK